jgi:hypothetical protein
MFGDLHIANHIDEFSGMVSMLMIAAFAGVVTCEVAMHHKIYSATVFDLPE